MASDLRPGRFYKRPRLALVIAIALFLVFMTIGTIVILSFKAPATEAKRREALSMQMVANQVATERLSVIAQTLKARGIEAERPISGKTYWIECGASAEFFDPATYKVVQEGNSTILPVGIYLRADNALDLVQKGYRAKNIRLFVFVWDNHPRKTPRADLDKISEVSLEYPDAI